jgi:hypothetical protein
LRYERESGCDTRSVHHATAEIAELAEVVRRADSRNPTATFEFYALDPNESVFESKRIMAEVLPEMRQRETALLDDPLKQYAAGRRAGLSEAANALTVSPATIRLHAGEMTAQEMRSVRAVLGWMQRTILQLQGEPNV